jgi:hypothetical protein
MWLADFLSSPGQTSTSQSESDQINKFAVFLTLFQFFRELSDYLVTHIFTQAVFASRVVTVVENMHDAHRQGATTSLNMRRQ